MKSKYWSQNYWTVLYWLHIYTQLYYWKCAFIIQLTQWRSFFHVFILSYGSKERTVWIHLNSCLACICLNISAGLFCCLEKIYFDIEVVVEHPLSPGEIPQMDSEMENIVEAAASQNVGDFVTHNEWWNWTLPNPKTNTDQWHSFFFCFCWLWNRTIY